MHYFLQAFKNYANFKGRARRKEYWMFFLFYLIFAIAASFADVMLGTTNPSTGIGWVYMLYILVMLIPTISVGVRRLHDVNKSGWFMLISFVPLVNIWLLVLFVTEGTQGENQYGPNPKPALAY